MFIFGFVDAEFQSQVTMVNLFTWGERKTCKERKDLIGVAKATSTPMPKLETNQKMKQRTLYS